jgi:hypothetical protein
MLIIFFDIKGTVHKEFVNFAYFSDVLQPLRENLRRLRSKLCRQKDWLLHHNNAPSHNSFFTTEFLTGNNMTLVLNPHYFFLLPPIAGRSEMPPFCHI